MKVLRHGDIVKFECEKCGCVFTELAKVCYSGTGSDGPHYCLNCPDCNTPCMVIKSKEG